MHALHFNARKMLEEGERPIQGQIVVTISLQFGVERYITFTKWDDGVITRSISSNRVGVIPDALFETLTPDQYDAYEFDWERGTVRIKISKNKLLKINCIYKDNAGTRRKNFRSSNNRYI